jgi:ubiquinone/menaquinone biosynthesis C-methylase UbiE
MGISGAWPACEVSKVKKAKPERSGYRHPITHFTDALVPIYNRLFEAHARRRHEVFRGHVLELLVPRPGERLLDIGCGTGIMALRIAAEHPRCTVCGIDLSPRMIARARREAEDSSPVVQFDIGSITDLPYSDGSFDVAITNIMFHHLDLAEKQRAVAEIARVLKLGGRYVSAEFGPRARNVLERHMAKGEYTLYPSHLRAAGLTITHEDLGVFALWQKIVYRVAVKQPDPVSGGPA